MNDSLGNKKSFVKKRGAFHYLETSTSKYCVTWWLDIDRLGAAFGRMDKGTSLNDLHYEQVQI